MAARWSFADSDSTALVLGTAKTCLAEMRFLQVCPFQGPEYAETDRTSQVLPTLRLHCRIRFSASWTSEGTYLPTVPTSFR